MFKSTEHSGPAVYVADQPQITPQDKPQESVATAASRKPLFGAFSVKFIAYASAFVIVALFLSVTATNLLLAKSYYQGSEDNGLSQRLADKAQALESQLVFFQQIVNQIATQPTTQDILENRNSTEAKAWAMQTRRFLPQAMGVALLSNSGQIWGAPADTQLGPQSLTDLAKLSQGESIHMPPVHRLTAQTSHFDLMAPVLDESARPLGRVFISFGLDTLQAPLRGNTNTGQKLVLRDGSGNVIAQHNLLGETDDTQKLQRQLNDSDWTLSITESTEGSLPSFLSLTIFNASALLLTIGIIAFLVRYALRTLGTDFSQIKTLLNNLAEDEPLEEKFETPQLRETAEILPAISHIQRGIDKKRQLLKTHQLNNEITGLPNRRQFNIEFARAYDFARRSTQVCVVRLQVQGLEKLTDKQSAQTLKLLSASLKEHTRKVDHISHLETDQFAVLMFGMSAEGATPCLERLHKSFLDKQTQHLAIPNTLICKLHCGYTLIHSHRDNSAAEVLKRAEAALTEAQVSDQQSIIAA